MKIINLKTEYLINPLGIDIKKPRISWNVTGNDIKNQKAFEILYKVNDSNEIKVIKETNSTYYEFEGEFKSRDFIIWKVRVKNELDEWSNYSESQCFSIGILKEDWKAKWIQGDYKVSKKKRYPVDYFKKEFEVKDIKKATLYTTSLGIYEVYINNKKVSSYLLTPGCTDPRVRIQYDTYDVSSYLKEGKNEIIILLADGWYRGSIGAKGYTYTFGKYTKVLCQLEITNNINETNFVVSDESWKWSNDGKIQFADLKDGEVIDYNKTPSFNGKVKIGKYNHEITASNNNHVEIYSRNHYIRKFISKTNKEIYEFKNNIAGNVYLKFKGNKGSKIRLVLGEILDEFNDVILKNIQCTLKGKKSPLQEIVIICNGETNEYESKFFYGGFKYISVVKDKDVEIIDIKQLAIITKMEEISTFECSNELVNTFYENTIRSCKSNFIDIPTDCPTRERMGWTGDSQIIFNAASYLFDCHAFFRKHVVDIYDRQDKNGRLPQIAPYSHEDWFMDVMNGSVGWADAGVLIPYRMYLKYRDINILEKYYDQMVKYSLFMIKRCGRPKGIYSLYAKPLHLSKENRKYQVNTGQSYGEWAEPNDVKAFYWKDFAEPHPEESMAYTSYIMNLMVKISDLLGKNDYKNLFIEYRDRVKKAYQELVEKPKFSLDTNRQCKQVRPIYFDLLNEKQEEYAKNRLIKSLDNYDWKLGTGFLSTPFILYVLEKIDPNYAYKLLLNEKMPGWMFMSKNNTGTIWEAWEGPSAQTGLSSLNHYSKGALVEWIFASMLGIKVKGENKFEISPVIGDGIEFANGSYNSEFGKIKVSWKKEDGKICFEIEVPNNTSATFKYKNEVKKLNFGKYKFVI